METMFSFKDWMLNDFLYKVIKSNFTYKKHKDSNFQKFSEANHTKLINRLWILTKSWGSYSVCLQSYFVYPTRKLRRRTAPSMKDSSPSFIQTFLTWTGHIFRTKPRTWIVAKVSRNSQVYHQLAKCPWRYSQAPCVSPSPCVDKDNIHHTAQAHDQNKNYGLKILPGNIKLAANVIYHY